MTDDMKKRIFGARTAIRNASIAAGVILMSWLTIPAAAFAADPTEPPKASYGNMNNAVEPAKDMSVTVLGTIMLGFFVVGVFLTILGIALAAFGRKGGKAFLCGIVMVLICVVPQDIFGLIQQTAKGFFPGR